jgi:glycosyltransferase involved in cell wall biosynthesis
VTGLPEVDFSLFTISPEAGQPIRYKLPANVVETRDLVLNSTAPGRVAPSPSGLAEAVFDFHRNLPLLSRENLSALFEALKPATSPVEAMLEGEKAWELLERRYQAANPMYPFADFFWAWKSSHGMLASVATAEAPDADLYHAVSTGYAGLAACAAKARTGKPFALTEHGLYHKEREMEVRVVRYLRGYQRDLWNNVYSSLSRMAYAQADEIIALFEHNRELQIQLGAPPGRCRVIPNGIDVGRFASIPRSPRPGFHVGLVGRVVPIKDIRTFIATCRIVADMLPEARFWCIGPEDEDPEYYEECVGLVESFGLEGLFVFTGRADVREYYAFLDVLLLTSVREAQPLVILEGYLAGVPCVATKVGNVPELLRFDDRFIAHPKDARKLAEGILYVHGHPEEMEQIKAENKRMVLERYDKAKVLDAYRELYFRLSGKGA